MNLLVVTKSMPYPLDQGSHIRNYYLLKYLSQKCDIYLIALVRSQKEGAYAEALRPFCRKVLPVPVPRGFCTKLWDLGCSLFGALPYNMRANTSRKLQQAIAKIIKEVQIDALQLEEIYLAENLKHLPLKCPVVLDAHNREALILSRVSRHAKNLLQRWFYRRQSARIARFEQAAVARMQAVFAVSEEETAYFKALPKRAYCVPNGVEDLAGGAGPREASLLFTGLLSYPPNRDAVLFFLEEVWPLIKAKQPALSFNIVGHRPGRSLTRYADERVHFLTDVEDIAPYLKHALLMVVPLRAGGGTRFKILQAFAAGLPVVSTTIGAEGLPASDGEHLLVRDRAESFAAAVLELAGNAEMRERLALNAAALVKEQFLWSSIVEICLSAYRELPMKREN